ncbi:hypothetical protein HMPREF1212_01353 [Parabacteroides sp. HGS0025]|nr:hypothetical protein HMPREF1212_01353 [Parabacteroides sp. HGS0025]
MFNRSNAEYNMSLKYSNTITNYMQWNNLIINYNIAAVPASYGMTNTMDRIHDNAQFARSSSAPVHVEMMESWARVTTRW